ncbi:MAG: hypothetical protein ABW120_11255 [Sedimenticola sp.]
MDTREHIGFSTPERTTPRGDSFLLKPAAVESWISNLPIANIGETSRQVFTTIVKFNRTEMPAAARIKSAEMFRKPVDYLTSNLRKYYFDASFPLTAKNRKIAVLNRELYAELAIAYKIYLESATADSRDQKMTVIALHRAMRNLCQVVYQSTLIYDPYPEGTWHEIHRLYAIAEQHNYQDLTVRDNDEAGTSSTISLLYRQALLFAISSPYRVRQREIEQVYKSLPEWSEQISVDKAEGLTGNKNLFIADLGSDHPPSHIALLETEPSTRCRQFDTTDLIKLLNERFADKDADNGFSTEISQGLARHLLQSFTEAPQREFVRTRLNFELKVAVGINAIHALTSVPIEEEPPKPEAPEEDEIPSTDWLEQAQHIGNPGFRDAMFTLGEESYSLSTEQAPLLSEPQPPPEPEPVSESHHLNDTPSWARGASELQNTFSCTTINESAGGYCINWNGSNAPNIKIGEVIGIQSASNLRQFSIGISRWMRNAPNDGMQLGVAIMAPSCAPIYARIKDAEHGRQCGLLLPELKDSELPESLILPTLPFKVGQTLHLDEGRGENDVRLTRLLESTGAFARFQFTYLEGQGRSTKEEEKGGEDDFDNIWSML